MKRLLFLITIIVAFFCTFSAKVNAQACTPNGVSVSPNPALTTETISISQEIPTVGTPVFCAEPNGQECYRLRGCNTGMSGTYGCLAGSFFNVPGQEMVHASSGKYYLRTSIQRDSSLTFWLEKSVSNQGYSRACAGLETIAEVNNGTASCDDEAFKIVGVRNGTEVDDYVSSDMLRLYFDGAHTYKFHENGFFSIYLRTSYDTESKLLYSPKTYLDQKLPSFYADLGQLGVGYWQIVIKDAAIGNYEYCVYTFPVTIDGTPIPTPEGGFEVADFDLCQQAGVDRKKCDACFTSQGVWTAIGCIPYNSSTKMVQVFITVGLGIGGGVVVLMVLAGSFLLSTSQGDPKRVEEAKGLIGSAVIGLLFIIFSITILRFIGIRILQIPGFGA